MQQWQQIRSSTLADRIHTLYDHFTQSLTCSHDISRINGFVRTDQDKPLYSVLKCSISRLICTDDIILNCFVRACLHQRNVLVGSRMINNLRFIFFKDLVQSSAVTYRTDQSNQIQFRMLSFQFLLNCICIILINIK